MKNLSSFQVILLIVFGGAALLGVLAFSGVFPVPSFKFGSGGSTQTGLESISGRVVIWGTLPQQAMTDALEQINTNRDLTLFYQQQPADTFTTVLTEALATGTGPDLVILPNNTIFANEAKLYKIPYQSMSEKTFKDWFSQGSEIFLSTNGITALPLVVDPLMMYYNRDLLEEAGFALPPRTWVDLQQMVPELSVVQPDTLAIDRSAVAFGTYDNITAAKDILAMLMLQTGNRIVYRTENGAASDLSSRAGSTITSPTATAMQFYTEFANPIKDIYSWNTALPNSRQAFLGEDLVFYFDYASSLFSIQRQNPNLDFTVTAVPAPSERTPSVTNGTFYGIAISPQAQNVSTAYTVANALTLSTNFPLAVAAQLQMAPVRRDLINQPTDNEYVSLIFGVGLQARSWLDPNPTATDQIFRTLVQDISSGRFAPAVALQSAYEKINQLLR